MRIDFSLAIVSTPCYHAIQVTHGTRAMQPPTRCEVEERAAIMEYDGRMSRVQAEQETARLYRCKDWAELLRKCRG